jgi:hypothetical protein
MKILVGGGGGGGWKAQVLYRAEYDSLGGYIGSGAVHILCT